MNLSFQKMFFAIATVIALFAILVLAKAILIPLSIALLLSFILFPLAKRIEKLGMNRILAAFLSIFTMILIIGGAIFFFSTQIIELTDEFSNFKNKIIHLFAEFTFYFNDNVSIIPNLEKNELTERMQTWISESTGSLVSKTVSSTATFFVGLLATFVFTFLILIYRRGLTEAFTQFSPEEKRPRVRNMFKSVQQVGQKYLVGMIFLTIVIGLANSIGLLIIGIDNPFLFGFMGAALAIIPYIGTSVGAIIPILYAFMSYDSPWKAIAVAILFWFVQLVADNFLTPKIVGGSLKINALAAILSLFIGAAVWGVAGMILFLPFAAMLKVVCEEFDELKPMALIIGNHEISKKKGSKINAKKFMAKIPVIKTIIHATTKAGIK
ncbi:MAG: AI-2E family transporter [Prolixibacteraceae bacterium]|nr:AI-2E family transporter [Prolixibacteraceae bacterium]MBN2650078.1 AI-2E family transporter [Prolixibacteraceae bacterium]